jgi:hypothetical protein
MQKRFKNSIYRIHKFCELRQLEIQGWIQKVAVEMELKEMFPSEMI